MIIPAIKGINNRTKGIWRNKYGWRKPRDFNLNLKLMQLLVISNYLAG